MAKAKTVSVDVTPEVVEEVVVEEVNEVPEGAPVVDEVIVEEAPTPKKGKLEIPKEVQELYEDLLANNDPGEFYSGEWCMDTIKKEIRKA